MKRVVLAGATGLIGSHYLQFLIESKDVREVIVLTRRPLKQSHPKLVEHSVDFSKLMEFSLPQGSCDAVFCCLGTTIRQAGSKEEFEKVDFEYVLALANWGIRHHAQQFLVISSMGANEHSPVFYSRVKGKMETEIAKLNYRSIDIFRPSLLVGQREKARLGEKFGEPIMQGPLRNYRAIRAETVAKSMVDWAAKDLTGLRVHFSAEIQQSGNP